MANKGTSGTNPTFPQPSNIEDPKLRQYLSELIRSLNTFDNDIFSTETKILFGAARKSPKVSVSSTYQMGERECVVLANASAGSFDVTLPSPLDGKDSFYYVKKTDTNAATTVTVQGTGGEFPIALSGSARPSVTVFSDGTDYWKID